MLYSCTAFISWIPPVTDPYMCHGYFCRAIIMIRSQYNTSWSSHLALGVPPFQFISLVFSGRRCSQSDWGTWVILTGVLLTVKRASSYLSIMILYRGFSLSSRYQWVGRGFTESLALDFPLPVLSVGKNNSFILIYLASAVCSVHETRVGLYLNLWNLGLNFLSFQE